jgi:SAM-dependent methyltransferase
MLACALEEGAASCSAVDTVRYVSDREAKSRRIDLRIYDGGVLPYAEGSFDRLWATDVLEHLRRPALTMREAHRVLKPEGLFICRVDLRDHYHLEEESNWLDCMRYSERLWRAMTWHRSSYVNRLRYSAWFRLFQEAGFASREVRTIEDNKLYDIYSGALWARDFDRADIIVYRFEVVLEKH